MPEDNPCEWICAECGERDYDNYWYGFVADDEVFWDPGQTPSPPVNPKPPPPIGNPPVPPIASPPPITKPKPNTPPVHPH